MLQDSVLFIPKKLRVGFQNRPTTTEHGKLSYVIYFNEKNKLTKEKSFLGWCDPNIPTLDLENDVMEGLRVLTNIKRNPYHFGEATEKVRVYDPRGFEFEISLSNFIFLLDHGDIKGLEYQGKYVFSWSKKELILLPVNSLSYSENAKKVEKINNKLKEKDMIVGASYSFKKKNEKLIYLGKRYTLKTIFKTPKMDDLIHSLNVLQYKNILQIKEYFELQKERHIFLNSSNGFSIESYAILDPVEEMKDEFAMELDDVDKILSTTSFSKIPYDAFSDISDKNVYFLENEKYECFAKRYSNSNRHGDFDFRDRFSVEVYDKEKKAMVRKSNYSDELNKILNEWLNDILSKKIARYVKTPVKNLLVYF